MAELLGLDSSLMEFVLPELVETVRAVEGELTPEESADALRGRLIRFGVRTENDLVWLLKFAERHGLGEVGPELHPAVLDAAEVAGQFDALGLQHAVVQVVPSVAPSGLHVGDETGRRAGEIGDGLVEERGFHQPAHQVSALDPPRRPRGPSAGEHYLASGLVEFLGELAPGLAAPDD